MRRSLEAMALAFLFALAACGGGGEEADTGGEVATEEEVGPAVSPDSAATVERESRPPETGRATCPVAVSSPITRPSRPPNSSSVSS